MAILQRFLRMALVCALFVMLAAGSTLAQDGAVGEIGGRGVVREGNVGRAINTALNPMFCTDQSCRRVTGLMFPRLLAVDAETGVYTGADQSDQFPPALALDWSVEGDTYTLNLRDDLTWSDGAPITAYDVMYSYMVGETRRYSSGYTAQFDNPYSDLQQAEVLNEHTIRFTFDQPTCDGLVTLDMQVIPWHVYDPDFQTAADDLSANGTPDDFELGGYFVETFSASLTDVVRSMPGVTLAGAFALDERRDTEYVRLAMPDDQVVFEYVDVPERNAEVDMFLRGELNFISNPPYERRDDLRAAADRGEIRVFEYPGATWYAIAFNTADPFEPRSIVDEDGNPLEQGVHPIFSDVRVRRAVQLALDVPTILEAAIYNEGTVLAANQIPGSWAFDPELQPVGYDPIEAERLLNEAGWYDEDLDGMRECVRCTTAEEGTELSFELAFPDNLSRYDIMANMITRALRRIGMNVNAYSTANDSLQLTLQEQRFDAAIVTFAENFPVNPDQLAMFTPAYDMLFEPGNVTSYDNPEVVALFEQARGHDEGGTCDLQTRADLYRQAQTILQADQPYAWLFSVNQMMAVRGEVANWNPERFFPLWNIDEWVIADIGGEG